MRNPSQIRHETKNVSVAEDWHPTVEGQVSVTLHRYPEEEGIPKLCKITVWGGDDTGMGIYIENDVARAEAIFAGITDMVTIADLRDLGFEFE